MRKILNKLFATAIDNYYHSFALRDKANSFRLLTGKHDIAHIASSVFKPARVLAFFFTLRPWRGSGVSGTRAHKSLPNSLSS
ncbi:hypothetical protein [Yersinia bercovieri]|uniref:hypothetical protein n=1 Tax=Yersinia bercovieri TaxID=634 RepID=UPI0025AA73A1|nr:hypothetical protein [Yersinia bercovieri]MDN0101910.1 hypothetical protein [Yersinia bercovieri]